MLKLIKNIYNAMLWILNPLIPIHGTRNTQSPVTLRIWFCQKVLGINRKAYWPVHFTSVIGGPENILIGVDAAAGISPGCYIQGGGKIVIGDYTQVGPNVGIISANHDLYDNRQSSRGIVEIGAYCWIGMGSIVLPGVTIGDHTVVAAGSIVTKSFPDGYCVLAGNPAVKIKHLQREKCVRFKNDSEYVGYIKKSKFESYRQRALKV